MVSGAVEGWLLETLGAASEACSEVEVLELVVEAELTACGSTRADVVGTTVGSGEIKKLSCSLSCKSAEVFLLLFLLLNHFTRHLRFRPCQKLRKSEHKNLTGLCVERKLSYFFSLAFLIYSSFNN